MFTKNVPCLCHSCYTQTPWFMFSVVLWWIYTLRFTWDFLKIFDEKYQPQIKDFKVTAIWLFKTFVEFFQIWNGNLAGIKIWKAYVSQFFPFSIFYCLGCHIVPLIIRFSKLLILLSDPVLQFHLDLTSKSTNSSALTSHLQISFKSRAYKMTLRLWAV